MSELRESRVADAWAVEQAQAVCHLLTGDEQIVADRCLPAGDVVAHATDAELPRVVCSRRARQRHY
jgi:hypothetical protein